MRKVMVRYRVKPERVAENEELVRAVYEELELTKPDGLRYATFRLEDGVSFAHIAIEQDETPSALPQTAAFRAFTENIGERCDEPPVVVELQEVGSYRFLERA